MRKGKGKRILACFLAITLFLTSGFLILFRDTVFGASNKSGDSQPYVDNSKATAATVGVRGFSSGGRARQAKRHCCHRWGR